jgi:3-oxoacyl-[acyl-carrier-protein] synthase II
MRDVVITGLGAVSPIGVGKDAQWASLRERRSGVTSMEDRHPTFRIGAPVKDFDAKQFVTPRKALKVMCPENQFAYAATSLAMADAGLAADKLDPDRFGVVVGANMFYCDPLELLAAYQACMVDGRLDESRWGERAMTDIYPLWMLKHLPNMAACQLGIAVDARGPNNTIMVGEVSGHLALIEGAYVIERGWADVMIVGGTGSRLSLTPLIFRGDVQISHRAGDPSEAPRPFDAGREGLVNGEGAGMVILESRAHAETRGANVYARLLGHGRSFGRGDAAQRREGIERSLAWMLRDTELVPRDIAYVVAHGLGTIEDDPLEAQAIRSVLDDVPVAALKSYFGYLGAGGGIVELIGGILGLAHNETPVTLNYERPDPLCPVNVIHEQPLRPASSILLSLSQAQTGQAVAVAVAAS